MNRRNCVDEHGRDATYSRASRAKADTRTHVHSETTTASKYWFVSKVKTMQYVEPNGDLYTWFDEFELKTDSVPQKWTF